MIGMNNYFYTFKGGNIYRHNTNVVRNNFYGVQYSSTIKSVFNDAVLENKLFKTVAIQGDDVWEATTLITDIQDSGFVQASWYEKKEQVYFAFVRNSGTSPANPSEYALRSLGGIGRSTTVTLGNPSAISFPNNISLGSIMSVGDYLYFATPPNYDTPILAGQITAISQNLITNGQNGILIDTTIPGATPIVGLTPYFLYMKNSVAESHGVLGHYCVFTLYNENTSKVELFQFQSDVMKSYP
jgi:hypothetical protein